LGKGLAEAFSLMHVDVPLLVEKEGLYSDVDRDRGSKVVSLSKLRRRLHGLLMETGGLVASSHVPDVLPSRDVDYVLVLRIDPRALLHRLLSRGWPEGKVKENVASEALGICLAQALDYYGEVKVYELDVTNKSLEDVLEEATKMIKGEVKKTTIDWLAKAEEDEDLASLLASC